jgi:molybdopterin converting factor small subunit
MIVKARLFANLRDYVPEAKLGATLEVELNGNHLVKDLVDYFQLPPDQVKLVYVNGIYREMDFQLQESDEVGIFPPIGGG